MAKRPRVDLPLLLAIIFTLSVIGVTLLINLTRQKKLEEATEGESSETSVSETGAFGLPSDFPVFTDAKLESSYLTKGEGTEAASVVWSTDAAISDVDSFYRQELKNRSWEIITRDEGGNSIGFSIERDGFFGIIGIGEGEAGRTVISVTIGLQ